MICFTCYVPGWTDKRVFPILVFHKERKKKKQKTMTTGKEPLSKTVWLTLTFGKLPYCQKSISVIVTMFTHIKLIENNSKTDIIMLLPKHCFSHL